jgi:NitT/TauT family transport system permease protein
MGRKVTLTKGDLGGSKTSQTTAKTNSSKNINNVKKSMKKADNISNQNLSLLDILPPLIVGIIILSTWELTVRMMNIQPYILPSPSVIIKSLISEWNTLFPALLITLQMTLIAFFTAIISGVLIAILFTQSKWIERSFYPYAVILQTTPLIAIAPLIIIWFKDNTFGALVLCAWIVAFFPIVSNTTLGLNSVDKNLVNLFKLYQANRWQTLIYLSLPSALPYFLGALKIIGGLALIGAIAAEFVSGTGGTKSGLAYQMLMASYNLQIPKMFASLLLISLTGITIFTVLNYISYLLLKKWHESAIS